MQSPLYNSEKEPISNLSDSYQHVPSSPLSTSLPLSPLSTPPSEDQAPSLSSSLSSPPLPPNFSVLPPSSSSLPQPLRNRKPSAFLNVLAATTDEDEKERKKIERDDSFMGIITRQAKE